MRLPKKKVEVYIMQMRNLASSVNLEALKIPQLMKGLFVRHASNLQERSVKGTVLNPR